MYKIGVFSVRITIIIPVFASKSAFFRKNRPLPAKSGVVRPKIDPIFRKIDPPGARADPPGRPPRPGRNFANFGNFRAGGARPGGSPGGSPEVEIGGFRRSKLGVSGGRNWGFRRSKLGVSGGRNWGFPEVILAGARTGNQGGYPVASRPFCTSSVVA